MAGMDRFIALAIRLVRMVPDAPTIMPATIMAVLFSARPAAAADRPVRALSNEITTGISAPPMGSTTIRPRMPASTSTAIIHSCEAPPSAALMPMNAAAAIEPTSSSRFSGCCSLPRPIGRPGRISCSLPNAISEPQNEIEPMIAANSEPITMCTVGSSPCLKFEKPVVSRNSAHAISATVPPPTPLNAATSCGISVILVNLAGGTPSTTPTTRPAMMRIQLPVSRTAISVAITAMAIPAAAIQLPRTAVFGPVRPIRP